MAFLNFPWQTQVIDVTWFILIAVWFIAARRVKEARVSESVASRAAHLVPLFVTAWLLTQPAPWDVLNDELWPNWAGPAAAGTFLTVIGAAFAIWARVELGRNWSANVTQKADHELIQSGPFAWVRHPIYTGLLTALLGTALAVDAGRGVLAFVIALVALWRKYRLEERFMTELFGAHYSAYRERVPALVPFWRR